MKLICVLFILLACITVFANGMDEKELLPDIALGKVEAQEAGEGEKGQELVPSSYQRCFRTGIGRGRRRGRPRGEVNLRAEELNGLTDELKVLLKKLLPQLNSYLEACSAKIERGRRLDLGPVAKIVDKLAARQQEMQQTVNYYENLWSIHAAAEAERAERLLARRAAE